MYKCRHFELHEFVPQRVIDDRGEAAWELLDERILETADALRDRFGKMTINNYHWGGEREWSGLRTSDSPYYSPYSQHSFGRAFDCLFADYEADVVRKAIRDNPSAFPHISGMELGVSWVHLDVRNATKIKVFSQ